MLPGVMRRGGRTVRARHVETTEEELVCACLRPVGSACARPLTHSHNAQCAHRPISWRWPPAGWCLTAWWSGNLPAPQRPRGACALLMTDAPPFSTSPRGSYCFRGRFRRAGDSGSRAVRDQVSSRESSAAFSDGAAARADHERTREIRGAGEGGGIWEMGLGIASVTKGACVSQNPNVGFQSNTMQNARTHTLKRVIFSSFLFWEYRLKPWSW